MKFDYKKLKLNHILMVGFVIMLLLFLRQCSVTDGLKDELMIAGQNEKALHDSVRVTTNKLSQEVFLKNTFIADGKKLKELNAELYKEVKNLKGDVKMITTANAGIKSEPIYLTNTITKYADGVVDIGWEYDTIFSKGNYRRLTGISKIQYDSTNVLDKGTTITNDEIGISVTTGLVKLDGSYQIFVKSNYPGMSISDIQGSILDKDMIQSDESSWVFGPYIGVGLGVDPMNRTVGPNVSIGLGITYNLNKKIKRLFKPF
jgi:hypothetical protein